MKTIVIPDFYTPDPDDVFVPVDSALSYDDVCNEAINPDLSQDEIDALLSDDER